MTNGAYLHCYLIDMVDGVLYYMGDYCFTLTYIQQACAFRFFSFPLKMTSRTRTL